MPHRLRPTRPGRHPTVTAPSRADHSPQLTELEQDPHAFGTTALVGDPSVRRLRVGDYRVFYEVRGEELIVWAIHVAHRSEAHT